MRPESDLEKLREAVVIFRAGAKLHGHSPDSALIAWAHGSGSSRKCADIVRDAWHDFEAGCNIAGIRCTRFEPTLPKPENPQETPETAPRRRADRSAPIAAAPRERSDRSERPRRSGPKTVAEGGDGDDLLF